MGGKSGEDLSLIFANFPLEIHLNRVVLAQTINCLNRRIDTIEIVSFQALNYQISSRANGS